MQTKINSILEVATKYDHFIFDMDGVIWAGGSTIESGVKGVQYLIQNQKNVYFLTNNASLGRKVYLDKLASLGIHTDLEHIYSSSYLVAVYMHLHNYKKAFNLGIQGLTEELNLLGIQTKESSDFKENVYVTYEHFKAIQPDDDIDSVITGFNPQFNYQMLCYASLCLQKGCKFIAANPDSNFLVGEKLMPGGGCIQGILERATGIQSVLVGKPSPNALDLIMKTHNINEKSKIIMIGDNPETDMEFGQNCGIDTILVTTGVTSKEKSKDVKSTYVCDHLYN